jgi:hypothetical protein
VAQEIVKERGALNLEALYYSTRMIDRRGQALLVEDQAKIKKNSLLEVCVMLCLFIIYCILYQM